ncbi:hypothetical protein MP638_005136 [Amoeboaphelidium occidentale]|nr:hypothetical protein MP638_005136 [Amoeboaphelidium occidentale]
MSDYLVGDNKPTLSYSVLNAMEKLIRDFDTIPWHVSPYPLNYDTKQQSSEEDKHDSGSDVSSSNTVVSSASSGSSTATKCNTSTFREHNSSLRSPTQADGVPLDCTVLWVPAEMHPSVAPCQYGELIDRLKSKSQLPSTNLRRSTSDAGRRPKRQHTKTFPAIAEEKGRMLRRKSMEEVGVDSISHQVGATLKRSVRTKTRKRVKAPETQKKSTFSSQSTPKRHSSLKDVSFLDSLLGVPQPEIKKNEVEKKRSSFASKVWGVVAFSSREGQKKEVEQRHLDAMRILENSTTKRAVFLISHQKISSPRPLLQQVVISNLMQNVMSDTEVSIASVNAGEEAKTLTAMDIPKPGQMPFQKSSSGKSKLRTKKKHRKMSPGQLLQPVKVSRKKGSDWKSLYSDDSGDEDDYVVLRRKNSKENDEDELDDEKPLGLVFKTPAIMAQE